MLTGADAHLPASLLRRAQEQPEAIALVELANGDVESERLTYAQLAAQALSVAAMLDARGCSGKPVIIAARAGAEYLVAVLGCMFCGAIAMPMPEHQPARPSTRWTAVLSQVRPAAILVSAKAALAAADTQPELPWLSIAGPRRSLQPFTPIASTGEAIAFVQFTSGSTGAPRGAVIRHAALTATRAMIQAAFSHTPDERAVTWLPPWHDMGLVGGLLQPLGAGIMVIVLPPMAVVQRPGRWLRAISRYRAQVSGGPMFGYDACVDRVTAADRAELDLSAWRIAFCGAEPVRADRLMTFAQMYEPVGFSAEAFYPCYGLAEATLFVSGPPAGEGLTVMDVAAGTLAPGQTVTPAAPGRTLVACGSAWIGGGVRIVSPHGIEDVPEGVIGEILVTGPHLASGYWNNATPENFVGAGASRALRTGDLGFLQGGALYVTGRLKDLLIIHGAKHHAVDIEDHGRAGHPLLAGMEAAAFGVTTRSGEDAVLVLEVAGRDLTHAPEIRTAVAASVLRGCGVRLSDIMIVRRGTIPRTTSGKIERYGCKQAYEQGHLQGASNRHRQVPDAEAVDE